VTTAWYWFWNVISALLSQGEEPKVKYVPIEAYGCPETCGHCTCLRDGRPCDRCPCVDSEVDDV
jgi:hypothetical protein